MKIRSVPGLQRGPALSGRVTILSQRGKIIARSWPKKRPDNPTAKQQNWRDWFKAARQMGKYAEPGQQNLAKELTKGTGLYPGDLLMMAARGNLYPRLVDGDDEYTTFQPVIEAMSFQGMRIEKTANQAIPAAASQKIIWNLPLFQTGTFWNPANPDRIIWPANVTKLVCTAGSDLTGTGGAIQLFRIFDDGPTQLSKLICTSTSNAGQVVSTGVIDATTRNYLEVWQFCGKACTLLGNPSTFVTIQVVEAT